MIGDGGVSILACLLSHCDTLSLRQIGLTDTGCQALAACVSQETRWSVVQLIWNQIRNTDALEEIAKCSPLLEILKVVGGNPVCQKNGSIDELSSICIEYRVAFLWVLSETNRMLQSCLPERED